MTNDPVLVPREPTPEMLHALRTGSFRDYPSDELCRVRYAAAIAAAPKGQPAEPVNQQLQEALREALLWVEAACKRAEAALPTAEQIEEIKRLADECMKEARWVGVVAQTHGGESDLHRANWKASDARRALHAALDALAAPNGPGEPTRRRDCRLCAHYRDGLTHAPHCVSVLRCEDSSAYRATQPVQFWEKRPAGEAPF